MGRCNDSDKDNKRTLLLMESSVFFVGLFFFRLNIPPFVPARTVLEGLESEDSFEKKPVKKEITDTKVKEPGPETHFSDDQMLKLKHFIFSNCAFLCEDFRQSKTEEGERGNS